MVRLHSGRASCESCPDCGNTAESPLASARARFDDTVELFRDAEARSELPAFMQEPLNDLLRTFGFDAEQQAIR